MGPHPGGLAMDLTTEQAALKARHPAELRAVLVKEFGRLRGRADPLAEFIRHARVPIRSQR
jgi:hypothetical protein